MKIRFLIGFRVIVGAVIGAVIGVVASILATPLLWKLEDLVGFELAGHSGPRDAVIVAFAFFGIVIGVAIAVRRRP